MPEKRPIRVPGWVVLTLEILAVLAMAALFYWQLADGFNFSLGP